MCSRRKSIDAARRSASASLSAQIAKVQTSACGCGSRAEG
jgi:hypothetical protein